MIANIGDMVWEDIVPLSLFPALTAAVLPLPAPLQTHGAQGDSQVLLVNLHVPGLRQELTVVIIMIEPWDFMVCDVYIVIEVHSQSSEELWNSFNEDL